jgi:hypothetical protein
MPLSTWLYDSGPAARAIPERAADQNNHEQDRGGNAISRTVRPNAGSTVTRLLWMQ